MTIPRGDRSASVERPLAERALPLADLILVQVVAYVGLLSARALGYPGLWGALGAGVAGLALVVPWNGRSLDRRAVARLSFWRDRRRRRAPGWTPFDHEQADAAPIGFYWDGRTLTSLIRVAPAPPALTVLGSGSMVCDQTVPADVLADCLRQSDIALEQIDVISRGSRSAGDGHIAAVYEGLLGPLPAIAHRAAWIAVRLDPTQCPDAIRARGGGWDAALRTAAVATRRVTNRLCDAGQQAGTTTASDMVRAVAELTGGLSPESVQESWSACHSGRLSLCSNDIEPGGYTCAGLDSLWTLPSRSTTITLSLRRHPQRDVIQIRGIVRLDVFGPDPGRALIGGSRRLFGRQHDAVACATPLPAPRRPVGQWLTVRGQGTHALTGLGLPASGCGQVVGADDHGNAVAVPLFGPGVSRTEVHGTLHLAQQVVLRSLALGARVRVHSTRAGSWRQMVEAVGDAASLHVIGAGAESAPRGDYSVELYDGKPEQSVRGAMTVIVVSPPHSPVSTDADVRLQLLDGHRDEVLVTTRTGATTVTMVASDEEMRFIGASFDHHSRPDRDQFTRQEQI
ncbi:type VII secretion protein EccE [Mycobacterium sp. djl-10]|nr:type VII secretion protein EccE [Mycobacterium sp. djl-10]